MPTSTKKTDTGLSQKDAAAVFQAAKAGGDTTGQANQVIKEANNAGRTGVVTQPATEPAVISSTTIDDLNTENKGKLQSLSKKGTTVGADGNVYDAGGSMVAAPDGSVYNDKSGGWDYNGKSYGVSEFYNEDPDGDWAAVQKLFAPLKQSLDASTLASVNAIHQQYDALKADQTAYNQTAENARSRVLLLGGSSRYAPLAAGSNMLSQTSYGLRQIADLDAKENMAIAQAQEAERNGDAELLQSALGMAEGIRKDKQAKAAEVMQGIQDASAKMQATHQQAMRDEAVADIVASGVTDPGQILKSLNAQGGDFTADEISKALKNLKPEHGADATYKFSNDDVGKMFAAGMNANEVQAVSDYYNGYAAEMPALTPAKQAAVQRALSGKAPAAAGGGTFGGGPKITLDEFMKEAGNQMVDEHGTPAPMDINPGSELYNQLKSEYDSMQSVALGKLTSTEKNDVARAGLTDAPSAVQAYFLGSDAAFRTHYLMLSAQGNAGAPTLDGISSAYDTWSKSKASSSSSTQKQNSLIEALKKS